MKKIELSLIKTHGNKENHCPERDGLGRGWRVWGRLWSITQVCITHGQAREEFALHVTACSYVFILWKVQKSTRIDGKIDTIRTVPDVRHNNACGKKNVNSNHIHRGLYLICFFQQIKEIAVFMHEHRKGIYKVIFYRSLITQSDKTTCVHVCK